MILLRSFNYRWYQPLGINYENYAFIFQVSVSFADEPASSTAFNRDVIEDINFPDLNCFSRKYATIKAPYLDENESQPSKSTRSQSPSDDLQSGLSENERRLTTCAQRRQSTMQVIWANIK